MAATELQIKTPDGTAPAWVYRPQGAGPHPGAVFLMDALLIRPAMHEMAQHLASLGYVTLLPDLFYRSGKVAPFNTTTVWTDQPERERLMGIMKQLDVQSAMRDFGAYFDALAAQPGVRGSKFGLVGYCMGGRLGFSAAGLIPERVGAVAAIHAGGLVGDDANSPHLLAGKITAQLYLGVADEDRSATPEQMGKLTSALQEAKRHFQLEFNPGAKHGYAVSDTPVYDRVAAERHWVRVKSLFDEALAKG